MIETTGSGSGNDGIGGAGAAPALRAAVPRISAESAARACSELSQVEQDQRKTADASKRQVIVAPAAGAVVPPREPIADIVPADPRLMVEAHIRTEDVSRVLQNQAAEIRFTASKYRTTHLILGKVFYVWPDRLIDRATNQPYYAVMIEADAKSLAKADEVKLQAGMPAEVYIRGESRTPLQYLAEPVTQVLMRAARER